MTVSELIQALEKFHWSMGVFFSDQERGDIQVRYIETQSVGFDPPAIAVVLDGY